VYATLAFSRKRILPNEIRLTAEQSERTHWEADEILAGSVQTFQHVGDVEMNTAGL
jgi:hypothetical protein